MTKKASKTEFVVAIKICPYKGEVTRCKIARTPSGRVDFTDIKDLMNNDFLTVQKFRDRSHDVVTATRLPPQFGSFKKRFDVAPVDLKQYFELTKSLPGYAFFWPALVFSSIEVDSGNLLESWGTSLVNEVEIRKEVDFFNGHDRRARSYDT